MNITTDEIKRLSDIVSDLIGKNRNTDGTLNFSGLAFDMAYKAKEQALRILQSRQEQKCSVYYDGCNTEYMMWTLSLMASSWLFTLLKSKTEKGHCQIKGKSDPPLCTDGSQFHNKFFYDVLTTYEQMMSVVKANPPTLVK